MARAYGSRAQLALAYETTYGTAPSSGYAQMPFASARFGATQDLIENELVGYGRDPLKPISDVVNVEGEVVVPVDVEGIGYWLKALLGDATVTGAGPYTHTWATGSYSLPSMALEFGMPEVPHYAMQFGARANSLRIEAQPGGSQLQATIGFMAQGESTATTTQAGTPSAITVQRFGHFNGTIKRNGSALGNVVGASVDYTNNVEAVRTIRSDGLIDGADATIAAMTGNIEVRFADTVLLDQAINGQSCEIALEWSLATGERLTITAHEVYLPRPGLEITGPGGVQASFDWQAALDTVLGKMGTFELVNSKAAY